MEEKKSEKKLPPPSFEEHANLFSRILFNWLNPLLKLGSQRALDPEDLPLLSTVDQSKNIYDRVSMNWEKSKESKPSIFMSMAKAFGLPFLCAAILKLIHDICQFLGPVMLRQIIHFLSDEEADVSTGYIYCAVMFFAALLQSICLRNYFYFCFRTGLRLRSSCVTMVYSKSLRLSAASRARYNQGEIMNLMEVDSQKFQDITTYLQTIWSGPFQIIVSIILLWIQLGWSTIGGVIVILLMIPFSQLVANKLASIQQELMKVKDRRINKTTEALEGVKLIKLQAWEKSFLQRISGIRSEELSVLRRFVVWQMFSSSVWDATPYLVSIISFALYVLSGNTLTTEVAFTSISLFNILRFPLAMFPDTINNLSESSVSMARVQNFLLAEEIETPSRNNRENVGITISNGYFQWKSLPPKPDPYVNCCCMRPSKKSKATANAEEADNAESFIPFELSSINASFESSQLTAIVGHVGCGKSSLLNAILGDMPRLNPNMDINQVVKIKGKIAYVPQTPFIMNATLRDNILFGAPFDAEKYQKVLEACSLLPDIAILPAGDMTEIGEKGINLSGGQKTRISLARAVYQNSDIYLLDDPLSAVDAHVGRHIFRHCIKGLLAHKCVLLVTHALEFLPACDQVIVLEKGIIEDQGPFSEVSKKTTGVLAALLHAQEEARAQEAHDSHEESPLSPVDVTPLTPSPMEEKTEEKTEEKKEETKAEDKEEVAVELKTEDKTKGELTLEETRVKGQVKRSVYKLYFMAAGGMCVIILILLLYIISQVIRAFNNWWLTYWSNDTAHQTAQWYLSIYVALGVLTVLAAALSHLVMFLNGLRASSRLHDKLIEGILRSPMTFFDQTPLGRITNRVSKDIYTVDKTIPEVFDSLVDCLFQVIATLVVIAIAFPLFILVIILLSFYYVYEGMFYIKSSREIKRLDSISRSPIYANFGETLDGTSVIRAYEAQDQFIQKNYNLLDLNQRAYFIISSSNCWLGIRLEFAGTVIIGAAALFAVLGKDPANTLFTSMAALAISYSLDTTQSLNWVVRMMTDMETQIVSVERIQEYSELPSEAPAHIPQTAPQQSWPASGDISIENLVMRYRPELEPAIKGLTVHIQPGEKVGVVGRTGAGKSSLVLCLMRIVELEQGRIVIDGIDISKIGLEDLRSKIAIIPQEPLLFSGTVRDNLDPFNQYTDEEIWSALERASLKDVIMEDPAGLEKVVEEHGSNYSVGQRQLLCIARALLRKSKVILMDEATASIDLETDMKIQKTIRSEFTDSTVITIAHRIHTIIDSDKVLVMELGRLQEFDKPSVLLSDKNSLFSQLVEKSKEIE